MPHILPMFFLLLWATTVSSSCIPTIWSITTSTYCTVSTCSATFLCLVSVWPCVPLSLFLLFLPTIPIICLSLFCCFYSLSSAPFLSLSNFPLYPYLDFSALCQPAALLSFVLTFSPFSRFSLLVSLPFLPLPGRPPASRVSAPMVVCAVHPPASHSAPSFLRQYAGHLGRTALRREPGGGLERDRAYLSLHRTGSLGTHTLLHIFTQWCMHATISKMKNISLYEPFKIKQWRRVTVHILKYYIITVFWFYATLYFCYTTFKMQIL